MNTYHIQRFSFGKEKLTIDWADGHQSGFHYIWLRDNAPNNRHSNGQKLIETAQIPLDSMARTITVDETVRIEWADDGSVSEFEPMWLRQHAYEPAEVAARRVRPMLWQAANMASSLPTYDYPQLVDDKNALIGMLSAVRDYGFAIIRHVPTASESLFKVIDLFGYVRETNYGTYFDVKVTPNPTNLAFTGLTLSGHTDNPYRDPVPTLQLLHFLHNNVNGGDSTLVDGFAVAEALREADPAAFELLSRSPVSFRFRSPNADLQYESTIIETNVWGEVSGIRFNNRSMQPFYLRPEQTQTFYAAYQTFAHMLESEQYKVTFKLGSGDAMLFDNQRILHGRIGYESGGQRHLQGCYADKDSLLSKLGVLSRHQSG